MGISGKSDGSDPDAVKSLIRSSPWAVVETFIVIFATLTNTIVLSRILQPVEFGMAAIALSVATIVQTLLLGGFGPALIRIGAEWNTELAKQVYAVVLVAACAGAGLCSAIALPVSHLFASPNMYPLILGSSISILFFGIATFGTSLMVRDLKFQQIALMTLVAKSISIALSILTALLGGGSWALIVGQVAFVFVQSLWVMVFVLGSLRPAIPKQGSVSFLQTSFLIVAENAVTMITVRMFTIYVGYWYGLANLGLINYSLRLVDELGSILVGTLNRVGVAYFSRVRDSSQPMSEAFSVTTYIATLIGAPIFMGLFVVIDEIIIILSGETWIAAIPVAKVLCLYWIARVTRIGTSPIFKALNKQSYAISISWVVLVYLVIASILVRDLDFIYVVAVFAARPLVSLPLGVWAMWRLTGASFVEQFAALMQPLLFAGIMLIVLEGFVANQITHLADWESLIVKVAVGAAIYLSLTALFDRKRILRLPDLLTGQVSLNARSPSK